MLDYQGEKFHKFIKRENENFKKGLKSRVKTMNEAIEMMGVSSGTMYQYYKSLSLRPDTVKKILLVFNATEEEIFGEEQKDLFGESVNDQFLSTLPDKPRNNANAKVITGMSYPVEAGETPFIHLSNGQYLMLMPLVNEYAYAGYLSGFADPVFTDELPKHSIVVDRLHKGVYFGFEVVGDSMDDGSKESIPDGAIATGREIRKEYWQSKFHTHKFKDYIIVSKTDGIIVKRIVDQDIDKGIITCRSLNQDKENYPDFDVHLEDVEQMFNVVNVSAPR